MDRTQPPRIATWMLEHSALAENCDALAGDLLEEFRAGRSAGWYWRQALYAFVVGWFTRLNARRKALIFALLWSTLAPAWAAVIDRVQHASGLREHIWRMDGQFSTLSAFFIWLLLNLAFLWTGLLVYFLVQAHFTKRLSASQFRQSFVRAILFFLPVYFAVFVVMNLIAFPGPTVDRRTMMAWGEIVDVRMWAMALRIPYFITMLCALWATANGVALPAAEVVTAPLEIPADPDEGLFCNNPDRVATTTLLRWLVFAGLLNSLIASILLCRLPASHAPSLLNLSARAIVYVVIGALAGTVGSWWYWRRASSLGSRLPVAFKLFAFASAAGWIWVPAVALLAAQDASACVLVAAAGSAALAIGLRSIVPEEIRPREIERELFANSLKTIPREGDGFAIALCIYAGAYVLIEREHLIAAGLLALGVFLFAWKKTLAPDSTRHDSNGIAGAVLRLRRLAVPAVLVTLWALLSGVDHRNQAEAFANAGGPSDRKVVSVSPPNALDGYQSVILWPVPEQKQIIAPVLAPASSLTPRMHKPLVIRFDGPYWYFQFPETRPGQFAHQAHESPLNTDIEAKNSVPLVIQANQSLGRAIRIANCREIQVEIENRDNHPGDIDLGILLKDSSSKGKLTLYLGEQPVAGNPVAGSAPRSQTLRFSIPPHPRIRQFDEITVMLIPNYEHAFVAPRLAIDQFELIPRE